MSDNYSTDTLGSDAAGWNVVSGAWSVCKAGSAQAYCQTSDSTSMALAGSNWWNNYSIDALVTDAHVAFGGAGIIGRATTPDNFYLLELEAKPKTSIPYWYILKNRNGSYTTLASGPLQAPDKNPNYRLHLAFSGSTITASIAFSGSTSYRVLGTATDSSYSSGQVGLRTFVTRSVSFTDVVVASTPGATGEVPLAADSLAGSVGVNTSVAYYFPHPDWQTVIGRVQALGVRHIRDGIVGATPAYEAAMSQLLNATNAKLDGGTDCAGMAYYTTSPTSPTAIQKFNSAIGNRLEYVEGPNEVDGRNDGNWVADTIGCLPSLRTALPTIPFIAPALANPYENAGWLGNISSMVDIGNIHRYFGGNNPGSPGWGGLTGCGVYGSLPWAICEAGVNSGTKPVIITETGYNSRTEVDETTQAKYLSRALLVNLQAGISQTFLFDLRDQVGSNGGFGGDGLLRTDNSIKPAFSAVKNEISYFSDPGTPGALIPLEYSLGGPVVDHLLFQKRDGTYVLALWQEVPSWNIKGDTPIVVPAGAVPVTLPTLPKSTAAVSLTDAGTLAPKLVEQVGNVITVSVDDHVTLLNFKF